MRLIITQSIIINYLARPPELLYGSNCETNLRQAILKQNFRIYILRSSLPYITIHKSAGTENC